MNKAFLLGHLSDRGVTIRPTPESGAMQAAFTLCCDETGLDGRTYTTYLPCEAFGKAREQAESLEPGALLCVEGKLTRRKRSTKGGEEYYQVVVLAWTITTVQHEVTHA